jgi:hypothetical protein
LKLRVENNLSYDNGKSGIHMNDIDRAEIFNNTVYNNAHSNLNDAAITSTGTNAGISVQSSTNIVIKNNIVVVPTGVSPALVALAKCQTGCETATLSNNLIDGGSNEFGTGSTTANPLFTNMAGNTSSTYRLYRSADNGASWSNIQTFDPSTSGKTDMWSPFGTDELYVLHNGTSLYKLSGTETTLTLLNTNATIATNVDYSLTGYKNGSALTLYVLAADANLYKSTDNGATWANIATLTTTAWSVGMVANPWVADALYYGAINFYKSTTPTPSFTTQNVWGDYYDNIDLLHADMMSIKPYQKTDGTKFFLIGNHGGIHYYPDPFTTTTNLTKTGIRNADYYDVTTIDGTIFAGAQDQGNQRFSGSTGTSILTSTQLTAGDYVRINSSVNNTKYWHEYPQTGASCPIRYYDSPLTQTNSTANTTIYGTSGTNMQYWIAPICNGSVAAENSILIGGGGVASGATTSQVIKLTYDGSTIVKSAYPFDFKADGNGYISALEHSPANANYMYVGLNNGKFYYSTDAGATFTQTTSFTGPTNAHTHSTFIHASRVNANLAFFSGGGGHIYKTTNGGVAFTDMSTGLPNTFVSEMVLNTAETLLFAATDAGPYVCVLSTGQWYSMATPITPVMAFRAVEWIASTNTVRFATYGRGIWDFQITSQVLPISYKSFEVQGTDNQQVNIVWATETERDLTHFEIERSENGRDFKKIATVEARNKGSQYATIDKFPVLNAVNYYRIKSVELSGKTELTAVKSVLMNASKAFVQVYPTFLTKNSLLFVQSDAENRSFVLYDVQQRVVAQRQLSASGNQLTLPNLPEGIYFYTIQEANGQLVKTGQLRLL